MNLKFFRKPLVFAAAAALLVVSVSAAALFLRPSEVAQHHNQPVLAQAFEDQNAIVVDQTVETGDFAVNLTGLVSGKNLTDWSQDVDTSHTYAVVALSRLDGTPIDQQEFDFIRYTLTPLVAGYSPSAVNNWTLGSSASGFSADGVFYVLLDTQDLNMFAHRTVYLAFYEGGAPSREIFAVDPTDGSISFAPDFAGPHALFTLPLDASKADPAAADEFAASTGLDFDYNAPMENAPMEPDDSDVTYRKEQTGDTTTIVIE
ncbi:MAG: hypothetical protein HFF34_01120 [Oscillospiraceae bacterium]|nr:hypothetical protein [Oscillospiraceae bacterium]MCI9393746.1 hypothetical protein [Oscillospiraceae bacterium]MCI9579959.1 hypothetical protein [Oscillospiraceae bacterium]